MLKGIGSLEGDRDEFPESLRILKGDTGHNLLLLGNVVDKDGGFWRVTTSSLKGETHEAVIEFFEVIGLFAIFAIACELGSGKASARRSANGGFVHGASDSGVKEGGLINVTRDATGKEEVTSVGGILGLLDGGLNREGNHTGASLGDENFVEIIVAVHHITIGHANEGVITKRVKEDFLAGGAELQLVTRDHWVGNGVLVHDLGDILGEEGLGGAGGMLPEAGMRLLLAAQEGLRALISIGKEVGSSGFHASADEISLLGRGLQFRQLSIWANFLNQCSSRLNLGSMTLSSSRSE